MGTARARRATSRRTWRKPHKPPTRRWSNWSPKATTPSWKSSSRKARCRRNTSWRSEEHTSELQSPCNHVCRLLLEKKKNNKRTSVDCERSLARMRSSTGLLLSSLAACTSSLPLYLYRHSVFFLFFFFFFNDTATTEIYTLSLHDALPIYREGGYDLIVLSVDGGGVVG